MSDKPNPTGVPYPPNPPEQIIEQLRASTRWTWLTLLHGPPSSDPSKDGRVEMVPLDDAEAAVQAAADTRTREIVDWLWTDAPLKEAYAREMLADEVARRFPVSDCDTTREET